MQEDSHGKSYFTILSQANLHFRAGDYQKAIDLYASIIRENEILQKHIGFNIKTAAGLHTDPNELSLHAHKSVSLMPLNQVDIDPQNPGCWISTGEDPHFEARFAGARSLSAGWYCVGVLIDCAKRRGSARFYLNYGRGYSEEAVFCVPFFSGSFDSRVIYIETGLDSVRFDPLEYPGEFDVKFIHWQAVSEARASAIMMANMALDDLMAGYDRSTHLALSDIKSKFLEYNASFDIAVNESSYSEWIENVEFPTLPSKAVISKLLKNFEWKPLISVIVPTYNTDETYLRECIESVLLQSYPHWELCIADDASTHPSVFKVLKEYEGRDRRIKTVLRSKNGHISKASNAALALASGDFVALLDHDDTLAKDALLFVVEAINKNPIAEIVYTDEDKLDIDGNRFDPHFKSDWNPDLLYSQNYVSHLGVYKKTLVDQVGGFRAGYEGSQDYDLLLRCLPFVHCSSITHVSRVLYHWRMVEGSTALSSDQKNYTTDAGLKALKYHFSKSVPIVKVSVGPAPNTYRVRWPLPKKLPLVSLIIPTRDRRALTEVAVRSILEKTTYKNFEIIIVDNGSTEIDALHFFELIQLQEKKVRVIKYDHPFNYSAINNFGVTHARGSIIGLVNNDIEIITADWLSEMVSNSLRPGIGCVGAKLYYSNDTIQHAGVICSLGGVAGHSHKHFSRSHPGYFYRLLLPQNLSAVTAACLVVSRKIFEAVGGLDEENLKVAFNDVDFCLKVQAAGYLNVWTPYAELYHYESISRGAEDSPEKILRFQAEINFMKAKWKHELNLDKFYNINLTKDREDFSLRSH